jgi:hypothetical protein
MPMARSHDPFSLERIDSAVDDIEHLWSPHSIFLFKSLRKCRRWALTVHARDHLRLKPRVAACASQILVIRVEVRLWSLVLRHRAWSALDNVLKASR